MTTPDPDSTPLDRDAAAEAAVAALTSIAIADARDGATPTESARTVTDEAIAADLETADDEDAEVDEDSEVDGAPDEESLPSLIEALLFVSDGPVEPRVLGRTLGVTTRRVNRAVEQLRESLDGRGVRVQTGPDGVQLVTAPQAAPHVEALLGLEQARRLSTAALETLAVIAYQQPVTRATIESVRGVNCDGALQTLRARGLIEQSGRAPGPGRPALFVTTQRFLEHFGLGSARDLPPLGDFEVPPPDAPLPLPEGVDDRPPPSPSPGTGEGSGAAFETGEGLASSVAMEQGSGASFFETGEGSASSVAMEGMSERDVETVTGSVPEAGEEPSLPEFSVEGTESA